MIESEGPNAKQIEYWNEVSGPKWVRLDATINAMIRPFGLAAIEGANPSPGEHVLDVGCGCGMTSLALARAVAPNGHVRGIDISGPMLEQAHRARDQAGLSNLEFLNADAQTYAFANGDRDLVFSRFGVMFFENPVVAFSNLRRTLRPGGRLVFACWQSREMNPWLSVPVGAVAKYVEMPPPPPPGAPGPLSLSDPDKTVDMLERAGYRNVSCRSKQDKVDVSGGKSIEEAALFLSQMGAANALLMGANPSVREAAVASIGEALRPYQSSEGILLDGAAWIVSASND